MALTGERLKSVQELVSQALAPWRVEPPLRASHWARKHFRLSAESSSIPGRFDPYPYQIALLDVMGNDEVRIVTLRKSARVGYTKCLLAMLGFFAHHRKRSTLLYQPTDSLANTFAKDYLAPMIRDVPAVNELLMGSDIGGRNIDGRRNTGNVKLEKRFIGSTLHVLGGTSANNFRMLTKGVVCYDEIDGFQSDVGREGSPISLGDKRIEDAPWPKSIRGTTPTTRGESMIEESESEADVVFTYSIRCLECGDLAPIHYHGPRKEELPAHGDWISESGLTWIRGSPQDVYRICESCGHSAPYATLREMERSGCWQSDEYAIDDKTGRMVGRTDGLIRPWPRHVAFHIWSAYSLLSPWQQIAIDREKAEGDIPKLKTWINTTLGELWEETSLRVEPDDLMKRAETYDFPDEVRMITFGADVQADRIELEFIGWGTGEESWGLGYHVVPGDPSRPAIWQELGKLIRGVQWFTAEGRKKKVRIGVVDSGYLPDEVYRFSRNMGIRFVYPGHGLAVRNRPIVSVPRKPHERHRVYSCGIGTEAAKDTLYRRLQIQQPGPGYCHMSLGASYDEEWYRQLTGEERVLVKHSGRLVHSYQQSYRAVEALDCRVYGLVAIRIAQQLNYIDLRRAPRSDAKK